MNIDYSIKKIKNGYVVINENMPDMTAIGGEISNDGIIYFVTEEHAKREVAKIISKRLLTGEE